MMLLHQNLLKIVNSKVHEQSSAKLTVISNIINLLEVVDAVSSLTHMYELVSVLLLKADSQTNNEAEGIWVLYGPKAV